MSLRKYRIMPVDEYNFLKTKSGKATLPRSLPPNSEFILNSVPDSLRPIIRLTLTKLTDTGLFSWNSNGEIVYKNDTVKGSNIIKLLVNAYSDQPNEQEVGFSVMHRAIKDRDIIPESRIILGETTNSTKPRNKIPKTLFSNWKSYE